jgi:hypothetical protein
MPSTYLVNCFWENNDVIMIKYIYDGKKLMGLRCRYINNNVVVLLVKEIEDPFVGVLSSLNCWAIKNNRVFSTMNFRQEIQRKLHPNNRRLISTNCSIKIRNFPVKRECGFLFQIKMNGKNI